MSEGQATILAAIITLFAAIAGVSLGAKLFGGRVTNLTDAIERSEKVVFAHLAEIEKRIVDLSGNLDQGFGRIQGDIGEALSQSTTPTVTDESSNWSKLRNDWIAIRDRLEELAADPDTDGRTLAKYRRIDRRSYWYLISSLDGDSVLGRHADDFYEAQRIWATYKSGRKLPTPNIVSDMALLRSRLVPDVPLAHKADGA